MIKSIQRSLLCLPLTLLISCLSSKAVAEQSAEAVSIRTTFMLHIVNYTLSTTTNEAAAVGSFCFLEQAPFVYHSALNRQHLLTSTKVPLEVNLVESVEQAKNQQCRYLFVGKEKENPELFAQISQANETIITIGESYDFVAQAGIIGLVEKAQKIKIVINREHYKGGSVKFSARLLKYANFTG